MNRPEVVVLDPEGRPLVPSPRLEPVAERPGVHRATFPAGDRPGRFRIRLATAGAEAEEALIRVTTPLPNRPAAEPTRATPNASSKAVADHSAAAEFRLAMRRLEQARIALENGERENALCQQDNAAEALRMAAAANGVRDNVLDRLRSHLEDLRVVERDLRISVDLWSGALASEKPTADTLAKTAERGAPAVTFAAAEAKRIAEDFGEIEAVMKSADTGKEHVTSFHANYVEPLRAEVAVYEKLVATLTDPADDADAVARRAALSEAKTLTEERVQALRSLTSTLENDVSSLRFVEQLDQVIEGQRALLDRTNQDQVGTLLEDLRALEGLGSDE